MKRSHWRRCRLIFEQRIWIQITHWYFLFKQFRRIFICWKNEKNILVGVIYRPCRPDQDVQEFCNQLEQLLSIVSKNKKYCILLGDSNWDLMTDSKHRLTAKVLDLMYSKSFFPLIRRPTRITCYTATLVDKIFINDYNKKCKSGILFSDITLVKIRRFLTE